MEAIWREMRCSSANQQKRYFLFVISERLRNIKRNVERFG